MNDTQERIAELEALVELREGQLVDAEKAYFNLRQAVNEMWSKTQQQNIVRITGCDSWQHVCHDFYGKSRAEIRDMLPGIYSEYTEEFIDQLHQRVNISGRCVG